jgi:hypothetical protein
VNAASLNLENAPFSCGRRQPVRLAALVLLLTVSAAGLTGCGSEEEPGTTGSQNADTPVLKTEVERGPVKFTIEVSPEKPRLSDEPQLTLTIRSEAGVRVEKPPFGQAMGDFVIRDFHEPVPDVDDGATVIQQVYTLEPTRTGRLTIAPIAVRFHDERDMGDQQWHTIESEALTVEVSSVLSEDIPSLADLKPAAIPIELPVTYATNWLWAGVGIVALVVSGIVVWQIRRGRTASERKLTPQELTPQELAQLELGRIVDDKLAEADVKAFYVELTGVVRRYIERSTGVNAPEQTTEEFLRQIVEDALFADEDQLRLKEFLEAADLVKFAAFEPDASDIDFSIDRARNFIQLQRDASLEVVA